MKSALRSGFKTFVRKGLVLAIDQNLRVDVVLTLGEVTESVTVEGNAIKWTPIRLKQAARFRKHKSRRSLLVAPISNVSLNISGVIPALRESVLLIRTWVGCLD
jgi:hypothetical protein